MIASHAYLIVSLLCAPLLVHGQPRAFHVCNGKLENVKIFFDKDRDGKKITNGAAVRNLPEGINVSGKESGGLIPDLDGIMAFEQSISNGAQLELLGKKGSIALVPMEGKGSPLGEYAGDTVVFRFTEPIFQLNAIHVVGGVAENNQSKSVVLGRDGRRRKLGLHNIPVLGKRKTTAIEPSDWYNVRRATVVLNGPGGILGLDTTICRGETIERCPPGERMTSRGRCIPCPRGTFLQDNNTCSPCQGNTFSSRQGSDACTPCPAGETASDTKMMCYSNN